MRKSVDSSQTTGYRVRPKLCSPLVPRPQVVENADCEAHKAVAIGGDALHCAIWNDVDHWHWQRRERAETIIPHVSILRHGRCAWGAQGHTHGTRAAPAR